MDRGALPSGGGAGRGRAGGGRVGGGRAGGGGGGPAGVGPWWVPGSVGQPGRNSDGPATEDQLDVMRAVIAVGWAAADAGTPVLDEAVVEAVR